MTLYTFRVDGIPKGQPRPRAFARKMGGKFVARVYDAGTAESWKAAVIQAGRDHRPESPLEGPLRVVLTVLLPRPKGLCRKCDPDGVMPHTGKPDADNLAKAILDAMTQDGWWIDDSQVCSLTVEKWYHEKSGRSGAEIALLGY